MKTLGLWGLSAAEIERLSEKLPQSLREALRIVSLPSAADLMAVSRFELLAIAPTADLVTAAVLPPCRLLLLPSSARRLLQSCSATCVIDYGGSCKDSLTLSSIENTRLFIAVQREIPRLDGALIERQELPLTLDHGEAALDLLFRAALLLVLGFAPETLDALCQELCAP